MSFELKHYPEQGLIELIYTGELLKTELIESLFRGVEMAREKNTMVFLTDCTHMTGGHSVFDLVDLFGLFEEAKVDRRMREAIVFEKSAPVSALVPFFETAGQNRGYNIRVFTDREEAMHWLLNPITLR